MSGSTTGSTAGPHPWPAGRTPPWVRLSRRHFLLGAAASGVLAACGGGGGSGQVVDGAAGDLSVARYFGPYHPAGSPLRVPLGLSDQDGLLSASMAPSEISATVRSPGGEVVAADLRLVAHGEGIPRPYYPLSFSPSVAGFHDVVLDVEGTEVLTQVQVVPADDAVAGALLAPGERFPSIVTPTPTATAGIDPICTRPQPCDLHEATPAELLSNGEPFVVMVSTPAYCQIGICGPVLDILLTELEAGPGLAAIHAEVYREPAENQVPPVVDDYAPVVRDLGLPFEPVLFTVGADGIVRDRLDYIFDAAEVREVLARLAG